MPTAPTGRAIPRKARKPADRFVRGVWNRRLERHDLLEFPGLLDTPHPARHLMTAGDKVYEGTRQNDPGQGLLPRSPAHGTLAAVLPSRLLALGCNAASSGLRARGTTIKEFGP